MDIYGYYVTCNQAESGTKAREAVSFTQGPQVYKKNREHTCGKKVQKSRIEYSLPLHLKKALKKRCRYSSRSKRKHYYQKVTGPASFRFGPVIVFNNMISY